MCQYILGTNTVGEVLKFTSKFREKCCEGDLADFTVSANFQVILLVGTLLNKRHLHLFAITKIFFFLQRSRRSHSLINTNIRTHQSILTWSTLKIPSKSIEKNNGCEPILQFVVQLGHL